MVIVPGWSDETVTTTRSAGNTTLTADVDGQGSFDATVTISQHAQTGRQTLTVTCLDGSAAAVLRLVGITIARVAPPPETTTTTGKSVPVRTTDPVVTTTSDGPAVAEPPASSGGKGIGTAGAGIVIALLLVAATGAFYGIRGRLTRTRRQDGRAPVVQVNAYPDTNPAIELRHLPSGPTIEVRASIGAPQTFLQEFH
ncbi:hypothetical protein GFY24_33960 [Nocardia sp. SYP-A9097]|uniref:hypothetical protein n=1 Tax=Nocardia sp. SYP-A9097 TaxID=2663237 RepID=UPI00129B1C60|nr:hypothetical protein [Nocardia sp. SYP-A9097]MRH92372.1 hypothetical protein [Nocardia sp. SYP-A9097]